MDTKMDTNMNTNIEANVKFIDTIRGKIAIGVVIGLIGASFMPFFNFIANKISNPKKTIESYYNFLNKQRLHDAYDLKTVNYQEKESFEAFEKRIKKWSKNSAYIVMEVKPLNICNSFAVVRIKLKINGSSGNSLWNGPVYLKRSILNWWTWKIDSTKDLWEQKEH